MSMRTAIKLTDPLTQLRNISLMRRALGRRCSLQRGALGRRNSHRATFSRDQTPVQITLEHRHLPPPQTVIRDTLFQPATRTSAHAVARDTRARTPGSPPP